VTVSNYSYISIDLSATEELRSGQTTFRNYDAEGGKDKLGRWIVAVFTYMNFENTLM
jgi:hypothetical protein